MLSDQAAPLVYSSKGSGLRSSKQLRPLRIGRPTTFTAPPLICPATGSIDSSRRPAKTVLKSAVCG